MMQTSSPAPLPALFVPHGAPTMVLEPGAARNALAAIAQALPRPRAIVVVSAHWQADQATVGTARELETIHDFWGFPPDLYQIRYPAPSAGALASQVRQHLDDAGLAPATDDARGLDHGAWTPLLLMYPQADIPVIPLSLEHGMGPKYHFALGRALRPLLDQGVLVLASGNLTHNLRDFQLAFAEGSGGPAYVGEFADWMWKRLEAGDDEAVVDYRQRAPHAARAHPSEEHLLPLHVALGAGGPGSRRERLHTGIESAVLAMDAYAFWPARAS
ncbi:MAG TPA: class III extradiol ring-cleavage dioxygenase [Rhodocyclaceae bacterium]|nr:class III extradiol ring-cleavage dioxygenase [Rhodocyclaceae bacterium]HMW77010.1 class III extradiol ring-cleavage dioxygenase [Rhodocyclaceae bacterium]HNE42138.1 class III extradiol ring-cleavage dioxygenase [Rhodocyclaceae bacterium]HNL20552.1 class III extradiol ring-cleavage dioxygenase [Rhodocyclaceae bacterium]HNM22966.1 class III extradiol ring-cleavage dioxygenase [Rhodocyclaceae bacterium]